MKTSEDLKQILERIDHRGYPAYKDTRGVYQFGTYILGIDHVQGDPFASPSKVSVLVSGKTAGFPQELYCGKCQRIATFRMNCCASLEEGQRGLHSRRKVQVRAD